MQPPVNPIGLFGGDERIGWASSDKDTPSFSINYYPKLYSLASEPCGPANDRICPRGSQIHLHRLKDGEYGDISSIIYLNLLLGIAIALVGLWSLSIFANLYRAALKKSATGKGRRGASIPQPQGIFRNFKPLTIERSN